MKKMIRLTVIASVLGCVFGGLGYYGSRDDPPPEDADLEVERPDIPSKQNAWTHFQEAGRKIVEESWDTMKVLQLIEEGEEWDRESVGRLLEKNAEVFRTWRKGLSCSTCVRPEPQDWEKAWMPSLGEYRLLARMAAVRASYLHDQGRHGEAFDECLRIVRFGHLVQNARGGHHRLPGGDGHKGPRDAPVEGAAGGCTTRSG